MDIAYLLFLQNMREATNGIFNVERRFLGFSCDELISVVRVA